MGDAGDHNEPERIINDIEDPVISHSQSPFIFESNQFL